MAAAASMGAWRSPTFFLLLSLGVTAAHQLPDGDDAPIHAVAGQPVACQLRTVDGFGNFLETGGLVSELAATMRCIDAPEQWTRCDNQDHRTSTVSLAPPSTPDAACFVEDVGDGTYNVAMPHGWMHRGQSRGQRRVR